MYCWRLMSNNKDLLTYLLTYLHGLNIRAFHDMRRRGIGSGS